MKNPITIYNQNQKLSNNRETDAFHYVEVLAEPEYEGQVSHPVKQTYIERTKETHHHHYYENPDKPEPKKAASKVSDGEVFSFLLVIAFVIFLAGFLLAAVVGR